MNMDKNILVTLDCGKANTKIAIANNKNSKVSLKTYSTRVMEISPDFEKSGKNTSIVEYDGKRYLVGSLDDEAVSDLVHNTKLDDIHMTMARFAIAENVDNDAEISVIINCPYEEGKSKEKRNEYANSFLPTGEYAIKVDDKVKTFKITFVGIVPEALAAKRYLKNLNSKHDIGIIDIGGLNSTYAFFRKADERIEAKCGFTRNGIVKLAAKLQEPLQSVCDNEGFPIDDILEGIKEGVMYGYEEETASVITSYLNALFDEIIKDCQKKLWDFKTTDLVFIGGGSIVLKDIIAKKFPQAHIEENSEYINVLGNMVMLRSKYGLGENFEIEIK